MAFEPFSASNSGRFRRPVWTAPPTSLKSLDDPLLRGEALLSPTVLTSQAQLPGLRHHPVARTSSAPAFPAADKRQCLEPLQQRPSTGSVTSSFSDDGAGALASFGLLQQPRKLSQTVIAFERSLSKDFQGQVDAESLAEQASQTLSDLPPLDQGLSYPARKENFKREKYFMKFESSQSGRAGSAGNTAGNDGTELVEAEELQDEESFVKDLIDVDHHIQDLAKSILFQHLERASIEERAAAKAEEARRRKEVELRRARKKEQMARDPKRKVALKIENKRRFSDEEDGKPKDRSIPLRHYEVYGEKGSEKVNIVDILKIQSQCEMLNESGGVDQMLEQRHRSEKLQRALTFTDPGSKNSAALEASLFQSEIPPDLSRDERAKQLRKDKYLNHLIDKMSRLRSEWKYMLPFDVDLASSGFTDGTGERMSVSDLCVKNPRAAQNFLKEISSLIGQRIQAYGGRQRGIVGGHSILETLGGSKDPTSSIQTEIPLARQSSKRKTLQAQLERSATLKAKNRKRWSIVKAVVHWLLLHFRFKRLHKSSDICLLVLRQLGEWSRIRRAMKGFVDNVTLLQRWCKRFLQVKRRRCSQLEKEWERYEDFHLQNFFRNKAQAIIQEQKELEKETPSKKTQYKGLTSGKAKREKQALLSMMEKSVDGGDISIDFRAYKIPGPERRAIINRWYMVTLRNHVRSEQTIAMTIREMLAAERELERFVKTFGTHTIQAPPKPTAEEVAEIKKLKTKAVNDDMSGLRMGGKLKNDWFRVSEEFVVRCIAVAAQAMETMHPFHDHPANRGLTTRPMAVPYDQQGDIRPFATAVVRASARPVDLGRLGTKTLKARASKARRLDEEAITTRAGERRGSMLAKAAAPDPTAPAQGSSGGGHDIEDLLKTLTPRLRQISETQNLEYRLSKGKEDKEEKPEADA